MSSIIFALDIDFIFILSITADRSIVYKWNGAILPFPFVRFIWYRTMYDGYLCEGKLSEVVAIKFDLFIHDFVENKV